MSTVVKSLKKRQQEHLEMLVKVEEARARLERRELKLRALESSIADLERRAAEPRIGGQGAVGSGLRRAQLIYNPASGLDKRHHAARLAHILDSLRTHGIEAIVGMKTSGKAARTLAHDAVRDGLPMVIVAAGDGTIGDIVPQLIGSAVVLGVIPIGTMNNVARSLGIPLDIDAACALIGMGTTRHIDVGRAFTNSSAHDEYFLECAGIGLAAIGALAGQGFEKRRWRVIPQALQRLLQAKLGAVRIELDGTEIDARTRIVTVSNAPLMANNMLAAPEAKMDDGYLDVAVYDGLGDVELIHHFVTAASHTPHTLKVYRARHVRITSVDPVLATSDMSIAGERTMIEMEVMPGALTMIVGNGIGLTNPVESAPSAPTYAAGPAGLNGQTGEETEAPAPTPAHA